MTTTAITDTEHWHALRLTHVGGSDAASILGISKRKTRWGLWQEKARNLPQVDLDDIKYVRNGKLFEPVIAAIGAENFGVPVRKVRRYIECDDCPDLGVTLDYEEVNSPRAPVEIKWSEIGMGWEWEGATVTEAPDDYLIQVQAQLACAPSAPYARLWAFIQGDVREMVVERRPRLIDAIKQAATVFMDDVRAGREPPVDLLADAEDIGRLAMVRGLRTLDWSADAEGLALLTQYRTAQQTEKAAGEAKTEARSAILRRVIDTDPPSDTDDVRKVVLEAPGLKASISKIDENPGHVVTAEEAAKLVGTVVGAKKGHVRMVVNPVTEKVKK